MIWCVFARVCACFFCIREHPSILPSLYPSIHHQPNPTQPNPNQPANHPNPPDARTPTHLGVLRIRHHVHVADVGPVRVEQPLLLVLEREGGELRARAALEAGLAVGERAALEHVRAEGLREAEGRDAEVALFCLGWFVCVWEGWGRSLG